MITQTFNPKEAHRVYFYGRMSSDMQNPRSPDQQFDQIQRTITSLNLPWQCIGQYRDDGVSGRYMTRRLGLMKMLAQIKQFGTAALILVDTYERLGRSEEVNQLRRDLHSKYDVLVLTADSQFADPTSPSGQALGFVEGFRATQDNRVKAYNVLRGKRDCALQKFWPGGPAPLGFELKRLLDANNEFIGSRLEVDPRTAPLIRRIFELSNDSGFGACRIAQALSKDTEMCKTYGKRFHADTINRILQNEIYTGTFVFGRVATDVRVDRRIIRTNKLEEQSRVEGFCVAIIDRAVWEKVNKTRKVRGTKLKELRARSSASSRRGLAAGIVLKYPLAGLVRCGDCGAAMRVNVGGTASKKSGRYGYYVCPNQQSGGCSNGIYCREDWLRAAVFAKLRRRLFPTPQQESVVPDWFEPLILEVKAELKSINESKQTSLRPQLESSIQEMDEKIAGWLQTLGSTKLHPSVREKLQADSGDAMEEKTRLESLVRSLDAVEAITKDVLDPRRVLENLKRLDEVMAGSNPTDLNQLLSYNIESIQVFPDRTARMRTCRLGFLGDAIELLSQPTAVPLMGKRNATCQQVMPRLLTKRRELDTDFASPHPAPSAIQVEDPQRFAHLAPLWFWEDTLEMPEKHCWAEQHATEVARLRHEEKLTIAALCKQFVVSPPTIRKALKIAADRLKRDAEGAQSAAGQ